MKYVKPKLFFFFAVAVLWYSIEIYSTGAQHTGRMLNQVNPYLLRAPFSLAASISNRNHSQRGCKHNYDRLGVSLSLLSCCESPLPVAVSFSLSLSLPLASFSLIWVILIRRRCPCSVALQFFTRLWRKVSSFPFVTDSNEQKSLHLHMLHMHDTPMSTLMCTYIQFLCCLQFFFWCCSQII